MATVVWPTGFSNSNYRVSRSLMDWQLAVDTTNDFLVGTGVDGKGYGLVLMIVPPIPALYAGVISGVDLYILPKEIRGTCGLSAYYSATMPLPQIYPGAELFYKYPLSSQGSHIAIQPYAWGNPYETKYITIKADTGTAWLAPASDLHSPVFTITYTTGAMWYCFGGEWKQCETYYGVDGAWQRVAPAYGDSGLWKPLG